MTLEAAFILPVLFLLLLVLLQPGIVLYDRMVMEAAAGYGMRLMSTMSQGSDDAAYRNAVLSQLEVVPDIPIFRTGQWDVSIEGDETAESVTVTIETRIEPLPLLGVPMAMAGMLDSDGTMPLRVETSSRTQPQWAVEQSLDPAGWTNDEREE